MSHFKTVMVVVIFAWTQLSFADLPTSIDSSAELKTRLEGLATAYQSRGLGKIAATQKAIDIVNKELPGDQRLHVAANEAECKTNKKPLMTLAHYVVIGGVIACSYAMNQVVHRLDVIIDQQQQIISSGK